MAADPITRRRPRQARGRQSSAAHESRRGLLRRFLRWRERIAGITLGPMRRMLSTFVMSAALACVAEIEPIPEPEPEPIREPPEGTLVYEGACARVFRSFEGELCHGTAERLDARACLIRDYLGAEPDLQRIDLYVTTTGDGLSEWCGHAVNGCASGSVAFGYESSMNHEIVHALVAAITGHHAHSIINEGLAYVLDGETHRIIVAPDLASLLANNSGRTMRGAATNFVGWMLMTHGPDVVLAVARDVPSGSKQATLEAALAEHLGMSLDEIVEAYEAETAWMYPELPALAAPVMPAEWADGIEMNLECSEAGTQGLTDEPIMWRTIDFVVDEPGVYLFPFGDAYAVEIEGICEESFFEQGEAPCEDLGYGSFGFTHRLQDLEAGRRYRARIEAYYPGPVSYTFLPMLGVEP
jgi:hypothetical protein